MPVHPHARESLHPPTSQSRRAEHIWLALAAAAVLAVLAAAVVVLGVTVRNARPASQRALEDTPLLPPLAEDSATERQVGPMPDLVLPRRATTAAQPAERRAGVDPDAPQPRVAQAQMGRPGYAIQRPADRWAPSFTRAPARAPAPLRVIFAPPASALGFAWPLWGAITSRFSDEHPLGIDIAPFEADGLVLAARDGVVSVAGGDPCCNYGYFVLLDHGDGLTSLYGHLRDAPTLRPGERVVRGTVLGIAGNTGKSEGVHLHFEVRVRGIPVDPEAVLTAGHLTPLLPAVSRPSQPQEADPPATVAQPETQPAPPPAFAAVIVPDTGDSETAAPQASVAATPGPSPLLPPAAPLAGGWAAAASARAATATPTPTPPARSPTPMPMPTAASVEQEPTSTPQALPSMAQAATTTRTATPTPPPAEVVTPNSPEPAVTPAPATTPAAVTAAATTPASTMTAAGAATAVPACVAVRWGEVLQAGQPMLLVRLEAESGAVTSLVAERCAVDGPVRVTARPAEGRTCTAELYHASGTLVRQLTLQASAAGRAAGDVRWEIAAQEMRPDLVVRLSCAAPGAAGDR